MTQVNAEYKSKDSKNKNEINKAISDINKRKI